MHTSNRMQLPNSGQLTSASHPTSAEKQLQPFADLTAHQLASVSSVRSHLTVIDKATSVVPQERNLIHDLDHLSQADVSDAMTAQQVTSVTSKDTQDQNMSPERPPTPSASSPSDPSESSDNDSAAKDTHMSSVSSSSSGRAKARLADDIRAIGNYLIQPHPSEGIINISVNVAASPAAV